MILLISMLLSFLATYWFLPRYIRFLLACGIAGYDVHKREKRKVAEGGGPAVMFGFLAGTFCYILLNMLINRSIPQLEELLTTTCALLIICIIGFLEDLTTLYRKKMKWGKAEKRIGIKQWQKPLLVFPASIPLMALMLGNPTITIPFAGSVNVGLLYPFLLVPIGVVGATCATDMLAGLNGLEAGLGFITYCFLASYCFIHQRHAAFLLSLLLASSLLAFLLFNWYPAKIFPGGLNYLIGCGIAHIAIIGNIEKFALFCFSIWFVELFFKARSKFRAESFGIVQKDNCLKIPYEKVYSLTHLMMKLGRLKEYEVTTSLLLLQVIICSGILFACLLGL